MMPAPAIAPAAARLPPEIVALILEHALADRTPAACAHLKLVNRATLAMVERALPVQTAAQLCRAALFCGLPEPHDSTNMRARLRQALAAGQTLDITLVPNVPVGAGRGPKVYFPLAERLEARGQLYDHAQRHAEGMLFNLHRPYALGGDIAVDRDLPLSHLHGRSVAAYARGLQNFVLFAVPDNYSFELFADAFGAAWEPPFSFFDLLSHYVNTARRRQGRAETLLNLCAPLCRQQALRDAEHEEIGRVEYAQLMGLRWRALYPELRAQLPFIKTIRLEGVFPFGLVLANDSIINRSTPYDNVFAYHLHRETTEFGFDLLKYTSANQARITLFGRTDSNCKIIQCMRTRFGERLTLAKSVQDLDTTAFPNAAYRPYTAKRRREAVEATARLLSPSPTRPTVFVDEDQEDLSY